MDSSTSAEITLVFKQGTEFEEINLEAVVVFSYTLVKHKRQIVVLRVKTPMPKI